MKRYLIRWFWQRYCRDHFILEIKGCLNDHDSADGWTEEDLHLYRAGLYAAIDVLRGDDD